MMMMMIAVHRVGLAIDTIFNTMPGWLLRSTVSPHVTRVQRQLRHRHGTTSPVIPWHWAGVAIGERVIVDIRIQVGSIVIILRIGARPAACRWIIITTSKKDKTRLTIVMLTRETPRPDVQSRFRTSAL